ncbi:MAG: hypothetical protein EAZ35_09105 [Sphingobacteriia bacterium]|nr:MAG: hypothetical protein EAZ41_00860 [Sphingobacteriia bacterium]TAG29911.1 MAG: hypothetical protein EAZ35_09105 [Sphingobacteriia bacterium]
METKDELLWNLAKKRAKFKKRLLNYILINTFLWGVWFFSESNYKDDLPFPWPVWVMLFWGIGLLFEGLDAYVYDSKDSVENEYNKLKEKQEKFNQ